MMENIITSLITSQTTRQAMLYCFINFAYIPGRYTIRLYNPISIRYGMVETSRMNLNISCSNLLYLIILVHYTAVYCNHVVLIRYYFFVVFGESFSIIDKITKKIEEGRKGSIIIYLNINF